MGGGLAATRRREGGAGAGKKRKKGKNWVVQGEWEWDSTQDFVIERLIGRMVADGSTPVPGRTGIEPGTVLYKVLWEGCGQRSWRRGRKRRSFPVVRWTL